MKEKILKKETVEQSLGQETICENLYNLSSSLTAICEIDGSALIGKRYDELKANILNAIYILSTHLTTDENP